MSSQDDILRIEVVERLALVTLNRPDKLNALDRALLERLDTTFRDLDARDDVGAVVLTGAGEKAFAAGADLGEMASLTPAEAHRHARFGQATLDRIERLRKPVIAAVNGFALGGGCELAMAAHLRVAAERASFGQPEVNLGLIPGFAGTQRLARIVGRARALDLILTGRRIDAQQALLWGLVDRVVPAEALLDEARALAREILGKAPLAVAYALEAVQRGLECGSDEGARLEASLFGLSFASDDMREGVGAFLEKRKARFVGR